MTIDDLNKQAKRLYLEFKSGRIDARQYENEIARLLSRPLLRFFSLVLGITDAQQGKDLFQTVMVKFLQAEKRPDLSEGLSLPWFRAVAKREWIDQIRRTRPSAPLEEEHSANPETSFSEEDSRLFAVQVQSAFADMRYEIREVAWLYFIEERTQKEIAEILGLSETTVNYYVGEARKRLSAKLQDFVSPVRSKE